MSEQKITRQDVHSFILSFEGRKRGDKITYLCEYFNNYEDFGWFTDIVDKIPANILAMNIIASSSKYVRSPLAVFHHRCNSYLKQPFSFSPKEGKKERTSLYGSSGPREHNYWRYQKSTSPVDENADKNGPVKTIRSAP